MISSRQRSFLRGLAQNTDPTVYIGKQGLTEQVIREIETGLRTRELVKVKLQESCRLDPKETANLVADRLNAEFVQAIGRRFTLYKASEDNPQIELPRK